MLGLEEGAWRTTEKVSAGVEVAGSRQEVQRLEAAGRGHQQEAVAAVVQAVEAATCAAVASTCPCDWITRADVAVAAACSVAVVETEAGGWREDGQLPWEAASRVQPEGAASLVGRQEGKGAVSAAGGGQLKVGHFLRQLCRVALQFRSCRG